MEEEFKRMSKDAVYDLYTRIVIDYKEYDKITKSKMLDEILDYYNKDDFLLLICTKRELDFLNNVSKKKIKEKDRSKYQWEIYTLIKKGIISSDFEIFEAQKDNVKRALNFYKTGKYTIYELITFMIGFLRANVMIEIEEFKYVLKVLYNVAEEHVSVLLGNPLFNYYCGAAYKCDRSKGGKTEIVYYRDFFDILDIVGYNKSQFGEDNVTLQVKGDDYVDIFYYGFPINRAKVKKMYDMICDDEYGCIILGKIEEALALNDREKLPFFIKEEYLDVVEEALDDCPSASLCGRSVNEMKTTKRASIKSDTRFPRIPQNNAHLSKKAMELYYKLYFGLLEYTNEKYNINPNVKKICSRIDLDMDELFPIDEYLWAHKDEVIDDFIEKNPDDFSEEHLKMVENFKSAITETFAVVGFEREYTQLLSIDGKLYMVKGINSDLDKVFDAANIPEVVKTTLIMFDGKILVNGYFETYGEQDNRAKFIEAVYRDKEEAIKYYHL